MSGVGLPSAGHRMSTVLPVSFTSSLDDGSIDHTGALPSDAAHVNSVESLTLSVWLQWAKNECRFSGKDPLPI